ncbi:MAG: archaeal heat shock protein Hsp20 [Candidatus Thermoplasmatota archaeon]
MNYRDDEEDEGERDRRRRGDPFSDLFDFSNMMGFGDMDKEIERMRKMAEEMLERGRNTGKDPLVYGFSVRQGPRGEPKIDEFGNARNYFSRSSESEEKSEWTPLTDVQETEDNVMVTIDIPGVEKENIDLNVKDDLLIVSVDGKRRYRKKVKLPARVDTGEAEATYNNGVLEVELEKVTEEMGESIEIK